MSAADNFDDKMKVRRKWRLSPDRVKEGSIARSRFCLLCLTFCLLGLAYEANSEPAQWSVTPKVAYIDEGSPVSTADAEVAIDYVVWSWRSRIPEMDIRYVGMTLGPIENAIITYKWLSLVDHFALTNNFLSMGVEQTWIYVNSGKVARSVISLNASYFSEGIGACEMVVFSHELGHALGAPHSPNKQDLMYYAPSHCRPTPTDSDVRLTGHSPTTCHTELTKDNDLFIPDIYGMEAYLKYEGDLTWSMQYLAEKMPRSCSGNEFIRGTGELRLQIKGKDASYTARLKALEGDRFELVHAQ